jgi:hypothetical protein
VDEAEKAAADAYVVFHYDGHLINPVHSVTYIARANAIVRANSAGIVPIPARIHVRRPLPLSTPPAASIDHVYVPRLHNAFGPVAEQTMSRPGVFTIAESRDHIVIADVSSTATVNLSNGCGSETSKRSRASKQSSDELWLCHPDFRRAERAARRLQ